ncbi:MAG: class I SAM-dependent methyltransferase [Acholeplasmataceae bacterium]
MYKHMKQFVSHYLLDHLNKEDIVVDATIGNGNDTLFLSEISKFVYGFDIQQEAIDKTKSYLKSFKIKNFKLILDSHENILTYIKDFKGVVFNLGYLPNADKSITTTKESTINTLKRLTDHLNEESFIIMTCYPGHDEGFIEALAIKDFIKELNDSFNVLTYEFINKPKAPFVVVIEKKRSNN